MDAVGGEGQCSWLRDPTKMTVVGYESLQIYNSHRARRELKLGIQSAGFLDLATEFVQIIVNNNYNNKFFYFAASIITYNNNRATYYSFNLSVVEIDRVQ